MTGRASGRVVFHHRGFGFLDLDEPGEVTSAFVAPRDLAPYLAGDRVTAEIEASGGGRFQAKALELVQRERSEVFGRVVNQRGGLALEIDLMVANTPRPLEGRASVGDWVVATVTGKKARVLRVVDEADASVERVIVRHGLRTSYPEAPPPGRFDRAHRRDLTDIPTITIDASSSRDLDDALSALPPDPSGALRILISIADVDALVPSGSALDLEARARATSVYLAGRTLPMLPPALSEDALSLLPGRERPTLTVELRIDPEGGVTAVDLYESVIRSTARLDYHAVARWMDAGEPTIPSEVEPTLRRLRAAEGRIAVSRAARGGVSVVAEEARVELDEHGREPTAWAARESTSAHRLIERLMVAANEAVAAWVDSRGLPALYRVHDPPTPARVKVFAQAAERLGFETGLDDRLTPKSLSALEHQFQHTTDAPTMYALLRRALGAAGYSVEPRLHFGLAAPRYLHFTSPIRRYPDLVVHRVVKGFLHGDRDRHAGEPALEELARSVDERMAAAARAEQERLHMLAARWFSQRIGEAHTGRVIAIKPFGLVLHLEGTGVSGIVQTDALPGAPLTPEPDGGALVGGTTEAPVRYTLGERLEVEVSGVNELLGRIDLVPR
jgi:ribonuclease R